MISLNVNLLLIFLLCLTPIVVSKEETTEPKTTDDDSLSRSKRAGLNMLRLGRGLQMLRMGKRSQPEPTEDELKELIFEMLMQQEAEKASLRDYMYPSSYPQVPVYPRYRRALPEYTESDEDVVGMPDLGKLHEGDKETMKEQTAAEPEEYSVYLDKNIEYAKRPMGMLRMGKRPMSMLRMGKRPMSMLRMGKRPMSMLRMGKRPMGMLRLGKRPMSMLRLGKRPMGMLRLGKRPMGMLRLGKRPMSMLRMGKKSDEDHSVDTRGLGMLRLGRST